MTSSRPLQEPVEASTKNTRARNTPTASASYKPHPRRSGLDNRISPIANHNRQTASVNAGQSTRSISNIRIPRSPKIMSVTNSSTAEMPAASPRPTLSEHHDKATSTNIESVSKVCRFLDLPPELRNRVYHLVYPQRKTDDLLSSDLLQDGAPSKALLLTCRQIYNEAKLLYSAVWDGNTFTLDFMRFPPHAIIRQVRAMNADMLERVTKLRVSGYGLLQESKDWALSDGVWEVHGYTPDESRFRQVLLPHCREEAARGAGYDVEKLHPFWNKSSYRCMFFAEVEEEELRRAKKIVGRKNLRKEEVVSVIKALSESWWW